MADPLPHPKLRALGLLLCLAGLLISGYLGIAGLADVAVPCAAGGALDCGRVQGSAWSRVAGVDISWLGALTWLVIGALLLLEARQRFMREHARLLVFGLSLAGFLFSLWLIYVQAELLERWCSWCLAHELVMTLMFLIAGARLREA